MGSTNREDQFLSALKVIDIDLKSFPDKTFDGLLDNEQGGFGLFIRWFVNNINKENVLTRKEEEELKLLKDSNRLVESDKIDEVANEVNPTFDELECLDLNISKYVLPCEIENVCQQIQGIEALHSDIDCKLNKVKDYCGNITSQIHVVDKNIQSNVKPCLDIISSTNTIINNVKHKFENNINMIFDTSWYLRSSQELNDNIELLSQLMTKHHKLDSSEDVDGKLKQLKVCIMDTEIRRVLSLVKLTSSMLGQQIVYPDLMKENSNTSELSRQLNYLKCVKLVTLARQIATVEVSGVSYNSKLQSLQHLQSSLADLRILTEIVERNDKRKIFVNHLLNKRNEDLMKTIELLNEFSYKLINEDKYVSSSLVKRQTITQNIATNPFMLQLKTLLQVEGDVTYDIILTAAMCLDKDYQRLITVPCLYQSNCLMIKNKWDKLIQEIDQQLKSSATTELQLYPAGYIINTQKCDQLLNNLANNIQLSMKQFVNVKESIQKDPYRKKKLLWTWFLTADSSQLEEVIKQANMSCLNITRL